MLRRNCKFRFYLDQKKKKSKNNFFFNAYFSGVIQCHDITFLINLDCVFLR